MYITYINNSPQHIIKSGIFETLRFGMDFVTADVLPRFNNECCWMVPGTYDVGAL